MPGIYNPPSTMAPLANDNSRFIVNQTGKHWGIWDMQGGMNVANFEHQHQANNYAQWLNYSGGAHFGYGQ